MTTLCENNREAGSTRRVFLISLIIPVFMGLLAWALASGAASGSQSNVKFLEFIGLAIVIIAAIAVPIPYIFKWNWESKYYGAFMFSLSTGSLMGIYPLLCIAWYSTLPLFVSAVLISIEIIFIVWWCARIVKIYRRIYNSNELFQSIYFEKEDAVYFLLQQDKLVLEKTLEFYICPPAGYFIVFAALAFLIAPLSFSKSLSIGMPFTHVFLAISSAPLNLLFLGASTKCWLIFYYYPRIIKKETGKPVYVDMSSTLKKYKNDNP